MPVHKSKSAEMEWLIYAQPYTPVLAEERRDRRVDHDRRAAGDAGARAPGELHLLLAAITERRIDRSMRAAETRCSAAAARQRAACSAYIGRQRDARDASAHLRLMGDRAGCESPRVQALALSVSLFCLFALHASVLVR